MNRISIITTVFNGAATIRDCISSIDRQTYSNIEHIIIDGASTDSTRAIAEEYAQSYRRILSEKDEGIYDGMNKGLKLATGDIVGFLNADDMYSDSKVLENVATVFLDASLDACYGDLRYVDCEDTSKTIRLWKAGKYSSAQFRWGWMPPHPTFFVRNIHYKKIGGFNLELGTAADYELMLRFLLRYGLSVKYIEKVLVNMRVGGASNITLLKRLKANKMDRKAWRVNSLRPFPWTLYCKPLRKLGQWFFTRENGLSA